jgi:voltage-gated sodium channel
LTIVGAVASVQTQSGRTHPGVNLLTTWGYRPTSGWGVNDQLDRRRKMLRRLFLNEPFIIFLVVLNAMIIFAKGFTGSQDALGKALENADNVLTLVFVLEAIIKIRALGWTDYISQGWNIFDFSLVVLATPALISLAFGANSVHWEYILVFRTLRVFKFLRLLKFVPNIEHLIKGAIIAAKSSSVIVFAFFMFNFIVSLFSCSLFRDIAPEFFGNPFLSFYSTFRIFTIEGWYEIPDAVSANSSRVMSFFAQIYFGALLVIGGVFGLSLINSIFVDSMLQNESENVEAQLVEIKEQLQALNTQLRKQSDSAT